MYVLDTSALKEIGKAKLVEAQKSHDLAISPLTFYELLCHLDEIEEKMTFDRQKGLVMKCQLPRILHDPFAFHAIAVGAEHITNESRFEEPSIIEQLLRALDGSSTLDDFYASSIAYPDGQKGRCRDVSARVRKVLDDEEKKYVEHLHQLKDEILREFPECPTNGLLPRDLADVLAASIKKMVSDYQVKDGINDEYLATKVTSSMYMHLGYKAARVAQYLKSAHESGAEFNPDPNDCEDSYICMYLELFNRDVLVTGDKGTLNALKETKAAFRSFFNESLEIESRVVSSQEFLEETQNAQQDGGDVRS